MEHRPWGHYESLVKMEGYQVKRIQVNPKQRLSLQYHHHRSEHWTIVTGVARVQVGEDEFVLGTNQTVYIPKGVKHRITNESEGPVEFIETQVGDYLGEDDIVRLSDDYNRN